MLKKLRARVEVHNGVRSNGLSGSGIIPQEAFMRTLHLEQKRTERSRRRFVLMLLESRALLGPGDHQGALGKVLCALSQSTRETDAKGWYRQGSVLGVIFTEIAPADGRTVANALLRKINGALKDTLSAEQ